MDRDEIELYVTEKTEDVLDNMAAKLGIFLEPIPISFNMTGRTVGMFCWKSNITGDIGKFRYNIDYLEVNQELIDWIIVHEVCHYVVFMAYGKDRRVKPHGTEWKDVMRKMGEEPLVRRTLNTPESQKNSRPFVYTCGCENIHYLTKRSHDAGGHNYRCNLCKQRLKFSHIKGFTTPTKSPIDINPDQLIGRGIRVKIPHLRPPVNSFDVKTIALDLNMDAKKVRRILRKIEHLLPKRESTKWVFNFSDKELVMDLISKET